MNQKTCKNCQTQFEITKDDVYFYQKLNIPDPTFCPECRVQRRMAWRNDRTFYSRKCDKTGESFISIYNENTPFPVYKASEWYKDHWSAYDYGQDFDFSKTFFEQWNELMQKVPRLGIDIVNCDNSDYCNYCGDDKNCYLDIAGEANEFCFFCLYTKFSKYCTDCTFVYNSELLHECINCYDSYNDKYSMYLENCSDCSFCFDLKGCKNCIFCNNLRHKEYYIFNKQHSKEEYENMRTQLNIHSFKFLQEMIGKWRENMKQAIHRDMYSLSSEECAGNDIKNSKNCKNVYNVINCWDSKYLYDVLDAQNCYDLNYSLYKPEVACELISTLAMKFSAFNMASHYCDNTFYCDQCNNSSYMFGCIGINHGNYCILNKKYTKEEYEEILPRIIDHIKKTGEWGEFFPISLSPWAYNETVAQEYMPLTKEETIKRGYHWKDLDQREYKPQTAVVPDDIKDVTDTILQELFACESCGKNYRIISEELKRYRSLNIAIPHKCPDCRHRDRIKSRSPRHLWARKCSKCEAEIQTVYSPEQSEPIYCEKCYLETVY